MAFSSVDFCVGCNYPLDLLFVELAGFYPDVSQSRYFVCQSGASREVLWFKPMSFTVACWPSAI